MDRLEINSIEEGLELLASSVANDRFNAARYFVNNSHPDAKESLIICRKSERVRHVRMALGKAISNLEKLATEVLDNSEMEIDSKNEAQVRKYLKAQAVDEFSGILLHELAPKLGMLKDSLKTELRNYEISDTRKYVDSLFNIFKAIEYLRRSSIVIDSEEVDLSQMIKDTFFEETNGDVSLTTEGLQPCITKVGTGLLQLALTNGIKNAYESLLELPDDVDKKMLISWGVNETDSWISIFDEGVGLSGSPEAAFTIGATNKDGHTGFGMAVMSQAMETLGGFAELSGIERGGAKLILRWCNFGE